MREIIILGKASGWEKAPDDECWVVISAIPRRLFQERVVSRCFDIHNWGETLLPLKIKCDNLVRENKIPYYLCEVDPTIPTSVKYPLEEVIEYFGVDYFSCSISYMIALAIYEKVDKINVYGVNMANTPEYTMEKGNVEFWLGIAMGSGIQVNVYGDRSAIFVTPESVYGKGHIYGYGIPQRERHYG